MNNLIILASVSSCTGSSSVCSVVDDRRTDTGIVKMPSHMLLTRPERFCHSPSGDTGDLGSSRQVARLSQKAADHRGPVAKAYHCAISWIIAQQKM